MEGRASIRAGSLWIAHVKSMSNLEPHFRFIDSASEKGYMLLLIFIWDT